MKTWEWLFIMAEKERVRAANAYAFATVEQERLDELTLHSDESGDCHPRTRTERN